MKRFPYILHILVCIVLIVFDQLTKVFARTTVKKEPIVLWDGVFELYYHENRGSIWGILQGKVDILLIVSVILFGLSKPFMASDNLNLNNSDFKAFSSSTRAFSSIFL